LVKVTNFEEAGAVDDEISRVEYKYDADDQLIARKVFLAASGTAAESQVFLYQHGQMVLQLDGTGNAPLDESNLSHRYLWGPAVDMLLADEHVDWTDTTADGDVYWALTDHLGTPRDWIDDEGELIDHAINDSFGNMLEESSVDTSFQWTGRWRDPLTGLQFNHARWYNPEIQRWMSEDRIDRFCPHTLASQVRMPKPATPPAPPEKVPLASRRLHCFSKRAFGENVEGLSFCEAKTPVDELVVR
jgi:RHS repeat-associated protein